MHCPNCGIEASTDQKFCRACGLRLERVAQLLAELLPAAEADQTVDHDAVRSKHRIRQLERLGQIAAITFVVIGGMVVLAVCAAMLAGGIESNRGESWLLLAISAVFILATLLTGYYVYLRTKSAARLPKPAEQLAVETTSRLQLEDASHLAISVTEQTTVLLEDNAAKRP